ncbi:MAG: hypothetical protein OJF52_001050 [Nitrospira sp.]|nr:MAG: hypothetical protein OJF52_001050 [Nitrospira sp.]
MRVSRPRHRAKQQDGHPSDEGTATEPSRGSGWTIDDQSVWMKDISSTARWPANRYRFTNFPRTSHQGPSFLMTRHHGVSHLCP